MRVVDDVTAGFAALGENYPGSNRKRRTNAAPPVHDEGDRWDAHPVFIDDNGVSTEFFYIGALAMALHRRPQTMRQWLANGTLPPAGFWKHGNTVRGTRRLWTRTQIEGIARIAQEEGVLSGTPVNSTDFTARVREMLRSK